jgi:hypothetical protein
MVEATLKQLQADKEAKTVGVSDALIFLGGLFYIPQPAEFFQCHRRERQNRKRRARGPQM